ncbi:C40 family peptidase [Nonomuraea sp. CA-143628]|uniref:C40 family peptidase n=1 Tax=Nonomuraea sp. CA-143628 TaxID=3239997 RepID=UPI003D8E9B0C
MRFNGVRSAYFVGALLAALTVPSQAAVASIAPVEARGVMAYSASAAVQYATNQLGKPYCYPGTGPSCFDNSGLTLKAWAAGGVSLPRTEGAQYDSTKRVARSDLQPGDLVFFADASYVGIYIGGNKLIDAGHTGTQVAVHSLSDPWCASNYTGAGRP